MARVLITGMSGVGKSSVIEALTKRGGIAVDTDYGPWKVSDELWDLDALRELLDDHDDIVVAGTAENQGLLYDRFDHVVLLTAPPSVMIDRLKRRTTNPYGSSAAERAEILEYTRTVEPLLRETATAVIETSQSIDRTIEEIEHLVTTPSRFT